MKSHTETENPPEWRAETISRVFHTCKGQSKEFRAGYPSKEQQQKSIKAFKFTCPNCLATITPKGISSE